MSADTWLAVAWELALFAGAIGMVFALDDLAVDALWLGRVGRRPRPLPQGREQAPALTYAIFVPAWREGGVIGAMLRCLGDRWVPGRTRVYVGAYPNDVATIAAVSALAATTDWLQLVLVDQPGPTTKGDCLNAIWRRLAHDRAQGRFVPDAVIIHDAEDVVAIDELAAHDAALRRADYSQLPVTPIVNPAGRWMSGHYIDEFAEAHLKELAVREAVGAILPTAGVGCAMRLTVLDRLADAQGPFAAGSLTEDYELGLRLGAMGARGQLSLYTGSDGRLIGTSAYFPHDFAAAVRQKTRWMHGIALGGWDRLGWPVRQGADDLERLGGRWMLWRDRRALLSALALAAGYAALLITLTMALIAPSAVQHAAEEPALRMLASLMTIIFVWRLAMRGLFTARVHGWRQGLIAIPRLFVSNVVLVACGWRSLLAYVRSLAGAPVVWDKTRHDFPAAAEIGRAR
jgi:bacteriophage N4 adsorption protein B